MLRLWDSPRKWMECKELKNIYGVNSAPIFSECLLCRALPCVIVDSRHIFENRIVSMCC